MKHPSESQLALFAGGDLAGLWQRWTVSQHVARCAQCQAHLKSFRDAIPLVSAASPELPKDLNWSRLAEEMTGNIRVGLAAGEAIARFDKPSGRRQLRLGWNAGMVLGSVSGGFLDQPAATSGGSSHGVAEANPHGANRNCGAARDGDVAR